ncbi:MAG: ATP-binding protein [Thermoactinospora sp.]|nr:ATP-binding protein [Thermoactinospora sp.]
MQKPDFIFGREQEWQALADFAVNPRLGATLGVVSGRRRQGKTLLLETLCEQTGGLYFAVPENMPKSEHLLRLGQAIARHAGGLAPALNTWDDAVEALFRLGHGDEPLVVVLDEFPYMATSAPELPSIIQHALSPRGTARRESRTRLILCGSSISFMSQLVSGSAALYGRAVLSLFVPAFDFRTAAAFWQVEQDHRLAAILFALVGGTPAYIEYASGSPADLDSWVPANLLNANNMLFRQPRMLLSEDTSFKEIGMYGTVLTAVAEGNHVVSTIARRVGKPVADLNHYLKGLQDGGFLFQAEDAFRANRSRYQIADSLVRFHHAIVYPNWSRLDLYRPDRAAQVWQESRATFSSQVVGPAFEHICRVWAAEFASSDTFGGQQATVTYGVINDRSGRSQIELDIVVRDPARKVLALGEVKWGERMGMAHLARIRRAAELLDVEPVACLFSGSGFTDELRTHADASNGAVQLVDLARLYEGC